MARKRKAKLSKVKKQQNKKNTVAEKKIKNDLIGGFLNVLAIVIIVMLVIGETSGYLSIVSNILKGLFGITAYLIPVSMAIIGTVMIISDKVISFKKEFLKGILCIILISATICCFESNSFEMLSNVIKYLSNTFESAINMDIFYGTLGAIIANLLVSLTGVVIATIILVIITCATILFVFDISLRQVGYAIYNVIAFIINGIYKICQTLFRKDDDIKINGINRNIRRNKAEVLEEIEDENNSMDIKVNPVNEKKNILEKLKSNKLEQVEFDFEKLGGKMSEEEKAASDKRDDFFKKQIEKKEDKNVKEVLTIDHTTLTEAEDNYEFPSIKILGVNKDAEKNIDKKAIHSVAVKLQKTLASFGVEAKVIDITRGPTVTRYELAPSIGVKVSRIVNLADDIALNLAAKSIRIEAPIPGKAAVGIELPNEKPEAVYIREILESKNFKEHSSALAFALGKDAANEEIVGDIAKMPHVLIAGSTGSGKSVCINSLIVSLLYKSKPSDVKMILIDPKMVELSGYNGIPHLLIPVVTDPKKAAGALNWAVNEMVNRYNLFASKGVKDIKGYNKVIEQSGESAKLPQIVIIIDELADLMMVAPNDVEDAICRLAQMARAAGMHLVIATQRPSVDVITGIIKANVPSRIAFTVSSNVDSRTILDSAGAEKLLGKGDMLYFPVGATKPQRIQGTWISEKEIETIVESIKKDDVVNYDDKIIESIENTQLKGKGSKPNSEKDPDSIEDAPSEDPLLNDAIDLVVDMGQASASMLQRRFKIGYSRAGRIVDQMEERGIISGYEGSKPRKLLISKQEWQEIKFQMQQSLREDETSNNNE